MIDWTKASEGRIFEKLAEGVHNMQVADWKIQDNKNHPGRTLTITLENDNARKVWANFNLDHPKKEAAGAATGQLRSLVEACGVSLDSFKTIEDAGLLQGHRVLVTIKHNGDYVNAVKFEKSDDLPNF